LSNYLKKGRKAFFYAQIEHAYATCKLKVKYSYQNANNLARIPIIKEIDKVS
jgi:hypothetical protein